MNILSKVTWKAMWKNRTRTIVTIIGVILSAALFTSVVTAATSGLDFLIRGTKYEEGDYHVAFHCLTDTEVTELQNRPGVIDFADYQGLGYFFFTPTSMPTMLAAGNDAFFDNMPVRLKDGRLPENSNEVLLPSFYLSAFEEDGYLIEVGNTITLSFTTQYEGFSYEYSVEEREFTKTFTIVGIADYELSNCGSRWLPTLFTKADNNCEPAMWHYGFLKFDKPDEAYRLSDSDYGVKAQVNETLLQFLGYNRASNLNIVLWGIVATLCAVIMIGSISLIYNAFSISVTERTKQFGLLSSVGATRKQLRNSVLFEAMSVSVIGIPFGMLLGVGGTALALLYAGSYIENLFSYSSQGPIRLEVVISGLAAFVAAGIAFLTVIISAWIPARRATKIAPMDAIRQNKDYHVTSKQTKGGNLIYKVGRLPGMLAKKYYCVSRKKYRATVISLTLSLILFLFASAVGTSLSAFAQSQVNTENFDILVNLFFVDDQAKIESIRNHPGVEKAAYVCQGMQYSSIVTDDMYTTEMLDAWDNINYGGAVPQTKNFRRINTYYLEDSVLREYLVACGIDPAPYFDKDNPTMLVCNLNTKTPYIEVDGEWIQYSYENLQVLADNVDTIPLFNSNPPADLQPNPENFYLYEYGISSQEELLLTVIEVQNVFLPDGTATSEEKAIGFYVVRQEPSANGTLFRYFAYDPNTEQVAETATAETIENVPSVRLGERIIELPFGLYTSYTTGASDAITLIGAMSVVPNQQSDVIADLTLKVSDYTGVKATLDAAGIMYEDYFAEEQNTRGMVIVINLFSYSFIAIIALICVANVFNTISTNIALRKRDFGMLKSVGMKASSIRKMMVWECLIYGSNVLLWGLPIGVLLDWLVFRLTNHAVVTSYSLPWSVILIGCSCTMFVVLSSMLYASRKLSTENPIDAIRQENL